MKECLVRRNWIYQLFPVIYALTGLLKAADLPSRSNRYHKNLVTTEMLTDGAVRHRKLGRGIQDAVRKAHSATSNNNPNCIVKRDPSGNFSANVVTATLNGSASSTTNFSGSLSGDVTGGQSSTVVATVGGATASNIASAVTAVVAASSLSTPNTLVKRDGSGNCILNGLTLESLSAPFSPALASGTPLNTTLTTPQNLLFTPDNRFLMVLNYGEPTGSISVFSLDGISGQPTVVDGSPFSSSNLIYPYAFSVSPDGKFMAVSTPYNTNIVILTIDPETGAISEAPGSPYTFSSSNYFLTYSPNGQYLVVGIPYSHKIRVLSVNSSTGALSEVEGSPFTAHSPNFIQFSPDGNFIAAADTADGKVSVFAFSNTTGEISEISGSPYTVGTGTSPNPTYLSYSPNGRFLSVASGGDYCIDSFSVNAQTGQLTFIDRIFAYNPMQLAYSPDSKYLVASALGQPPHGYITIYSVDQQTGIKTPVTNYSAFELGLYPYRLTFSPNGNFLGVLSTYEKNLAIVSGMSSQISIDQNLCVNGNLILAPTDSVGRAISFGEGHFIHNAGVNNTFVGQGAGNLSISGEGNLGVGTNSLRGCTSGSHNIAVGADAGTSLTSGSNNIYIAADAVSGTESNTIRIGNESTACYISGVNGATSADGVQVLINSNGQLGTTTSSRIFKKEIETMGDKTRKLRDLNPVIFKYNESIDPTGLVQYGLLAEEVAAIYPELVTYDKQGKPSAIRYHELTPMLLNEYQRLLDKLEVLEKRLEEK